MWQMVIAALALATPLVDSEGSARPQPSGPYEVLLNQYEVARLAAINASNGAKTEEEQDRVVWPSLSEYGPRFLELAERNPGGPTARDALVWIVEQGVSVYDAEPQFLDMMTRAMERLARDYSSDEKVGQLCLGLTVYASPLRDKFLRSVYQSSTDRTVRGRACLALGEYLKRKGNIVQEFSGEIPAAELQELEQRFGKIYLSHLRSGSDKGLFDESEKVLKRVLADYGEIPYSRGSKGPTSKSTLADVARRDLFELRHLLIGKKAPEIEGEDLDGKPMKLSDYRGKVVVLVFWGTWCGPCMAQVPHERSLATRLDGKPFALLGVDVNDEKRHARKVAEDQRMTWRSWWDGGETPRISTLWNVRLFPSVYVLDHRGVIRYRQVHGEDLDKAVDKLLKNLRSDAGELGTPPSRKP